VRDRPAVGARRGRGEVTVRSVNQATASTRGAARVVTDAAPADGLRLAPDLVLPTSVVAMRIPIFAEPDAGKSVLLAVIMEELWRLRLQFVMIDPLGTGWGIKVGRDGKSAGIAVPYLGGRGRYADAPLRPDGGAVVARALVKTGVSMVLNVSHFSRPDQNRFVADFWNELLVLASDRHEAGDPLLILNLVDEAGYFMPETPRGKEQARAQDAGERIARQGRTVGLGFVAPTQRPQGLDKDVLGVWEVVILLRITERAAIDAAMRHIEHVLGEDLAAEIRASLPHLGPGEAWIVSPRVLGYTKRVQLRMRDTYDSTHTPRPGERRPAPTSMAKADLSALVEALSAPPPEPAGGGADEAAGPTTVAPTLKAARARVRSLEDELSRARAARPAPVETIVEVPVFSDGDRVLLETTTRAVHDAFEQVRNLADAIAAVATRVDGARHPPAVRREAPASAPLPARAVRRGNALPRPPAAPARSPEVPKAGAAPNLKRGARKMLATLAKMHPVALTETQLGTMAKLSSGGGTFGVYLRALRAARYVTYEGGLLGITAAGFRAIGVRPPGRPTSQKAALAAFRQGLKAGARKMLDALTAAYPADIERSALGKAAGIESEGGTFGVYLGLLKSNGLAVVTRREGETFVRANVSSFGKRGAQGR
jgi:hypothetical protein